MWAAIRTGKKNMKNVTLKDIAQKLRLSEATVSLAINNKTIVNEETRKRVLECARDMNYKPNPLARGLATSKSMTIGFICSDPENPFIGKMLKLISRYSNQQGYSVMVAISEGSVVREGKCLQNFLDKRLDGVIIFPVDAPGNPAEAFTAAREYGIPLVFCDTYYPGYEQDCIMTDYTKGVYLQTEHLLKTGHRSIWYLTARYREIPVSRLRINGYKKAYGDMGIARQDSWIFGCEKATGEAAYQLAKRLLQEYERPDAILTLNDYMAYGVRQAIREAGYRIPEDISLAGYDDAFSELLYENALTTVRQDADLIARECVRLLLTKINPDYRLEEPLIRVTEPELVIRNTTRNRREERQGA